MSHLQRRQFSSLAQTTAPFEARTRFTAGIRGNKQVEQAVTDGIRPYINFVHDRISKCVSVSDAFLTELYGSGTEQERVSHLFDALDIVTEQLCELDARCSLHEIAQHLLERTKSSRTTDLKRTKDDPTVHGEHHLVFACLGWLSMLFAPGHELFGSTLHLAEVSLITPPGRNGVLPSSEIHRPVGTMLRRMGLLPIPCPAMPPATRNTARQPPQIIKLSILCYASLHQIGAVSIVWVNNLMEHCEFDSERQELKVFRFPAYCLHAMRTASEVKILEGILGAHTCGQPLKSCNRVLPEAIQSYLREVLLSYRVLFGQERESRRRFRSREQSRARFKSDEDPILLALCGRKHPPIVADYLHIESEKQVFDLQVDFPHLGERLLQVHNYNVNQKPSLWRSLFLRDPRDTRESFNLFLTVVVVGGISISLSFIQTVVAVVALVRKLD